MPLLTLNGIEVPITQASRAQLTVGKESRAFNGTHRLGRRGLRREWRFTTGPLALEESAALRGLVEGRGEHWAFEDTQYSDAGLAPFRSSGDAVYIDRAGYGRGLYLSPGYSAFAEYRVEPAVQWTLLYFGVSSAGDWVPLVLRSDGARWQNGARLDSVELRAFTYDAATGVLRQAAPEFGGSDWAAGQARTAGSRTVVTPLNAGNTVFECTVAGTTGTSAPAWPATYGATLVDGTVTWTCRGPFLSRVFDLTWVPYAMPDAWVQTLTALLRTRPLYDLPRLTAAGSFAPAPVTVLGEVVDAKAQQLVRNGALSLGEQVTFILREV